MKGTEPLVALARKSEQITNLDALKLDGRNANRGTKRGAAMLDPSLAEYGAGWSVLVDRSGNVSRPNDPGNPLHRSFS
jgi:hypothetical protein